MTFGQWSRRLKEALSSLPRKERRRVLSYYTEMFEDRAEAGMTEEEILQEFGTPAEAAARILEESGREPKKAHPFIGSAILFLWAIPAGVVLVCLAVCGAALAVSGFAVAVSGAAYSVYFLIQTATEGFTGAMLAQTGIGLALAGIGVLLIPLFFSAAKALFRLCGKVFAGTGRLMTGKRRAA